MNKLKSIEDPKEWIENTHEKHYIEYKTAAKELPKAIWETYSSFCNTSGGIIILGVEEGKTKNVICGVSEPEKILSDFWNQISNPQKVSKRTIRNEDVYIVEPVVGRKVIVIEVHEASEQEKPIYINGSIDKSYIRTGDGDRLCTKEELAAFIRNAQDNQDGLVALNFTVDDLDGDSLITFKEIVSKRLPAKKYLEMTDEDFLVEIGAASRDRASGKIQILKGTVLFLGKVNAIHEIYAHYHVDYFNLRGDNPRWSDRVSDDEPGVYEMNLFNFYRIVSDKLTMLCKEAFVLGKDQLRLPVADFDETLREALVNCLVHADYVQGSPSIKIEVCDGWFKFINPGKMLVSPQQFIVGGYSKIRNEIIMKLFRLLGASERQGFGGPLIYKTAVINNYRRPEIYTDLERTELSVWELDLIDAYPELSADEKECLRAITKAAGAISIPAIVQQTGITDYSVRKGVEKLYNMELIKQTGSGRGTKYLLRADTPEMYTKLQIEMDKLKKRFV